MSTDSFLPSPGLYYEAIPAAGRKRSSTLITLILPAVCCGAALLFAAQQAAPFVLPSSATLDAELPHCDPSPGAAYDVSAVEWGKVRSDLTHLVNECQCGPILIRLAWHDSGTYNASDKTGGSRGAQRFPSGEAADPANAGLWIARSHLAPYKERYPAISFADLWALAAVVAIKEMGGPQVPFRAGRADIRSEGECMAHGRLPDGALGASHLRQIFSRMGFDDEGIVALSGAHTFGRCHADRSGFDGPWTETPMHFDGSYFELLLNCEWKPVSAPTGKPQMACDDKPGLMMLNTDVALVSDPLLKVHVGRFAKSEELFRTHFARAFQRLQELGHPKLTQVSF